MPFFQKIQGGNVHCTARHRLVAAVAEDTSTGQVGQIGYFARNGWQDPCAFLDMARVTVD